MTLPLPSPLLPAFPSNQVLSIELWMMAPVPVPFDQPLLTIGTSASEAGSLGITRGALGTILISRGGDDWDTGYTPAPSQWHHLAATHTTGWWSGSTSTVSPMLNAPSAA